ncbi:MAG TPA: DUF2877 domain-containing protein [Anaerolineaceae bacterium]
MHLQALSIGESVPRDHFDAVVQSAFDSALNLRLAEEDRLVTLLQAEHYELPQGIRIWQKGLSLQFIDPGTRAALRGGILRFESAALSVDLRAARVWDRRVSHLRLQPDTAALQAAWAAAWQLLNAEQRRKNADLIAEILLQPGARSLLSQRVGALLGPLLRAAADLDAKLAVDHARGLIGLGPGVTPSGDDFLIGFLAALWSIAGDAPERENFLRAFGAGLVAAAQHTSEISRTYLFHAARGQFSSAVFDLVAAFALQGEISSAVQAAVHVGHTSGMDTVTGFLLAVPAWYPRVNAPWTAAGVLI